MRTLEISFEERLQEIEVYLDLLESLERQVQSGPPTIGGSPITSQQQKILYSAVYLQLYNLVEATATWCISGIASAASEGNRWRPGDLADEIRREWVRTNARTHVPLNPENRLSAAVSLCEMLVKATFVAPWEIECGGGGNWDDAQIEEMTRRLGLKLQISNPVFRDIKRHLRDDKGPLALVKDLRNKLAHGNLSFTECGDGVTVSELKSIKEKAAKYLREVVAAYQDFISAYEFVIPSRRPTSGVAT